jgi:hypothetical protein
MVTRRALVSASALGALSSTVGAEGADWDERQRGGDADSAQQLKDIKDELSRIRAILDDSLRQPGLGSGVVGRIRQQFDLYVRANQRYPEYCDIGQAVFTDLYDWHVKHMQELQVTRMDNRMAIRFMFTWMVLRPEQDPLYVGIPY